MPDFLPLLAAGLGVVGAGYLGLAFLTGEKSEPETPVVEMVSVPDAPEATEVEDIIVLDWVGDRFEVAPSAPRLDITM